MLASVMPSVAPGSIDVVGLLSLLGAGLVLAWAGVVLAIHVSLTRPPRRGIGSRIARGLPALPADLDPAPAYEEITGPRDAPGWRLLGGNANGPDLLFVHGWGRSRHDVLDRAPTLLDHVATITAFDLPGHGEHSDASTHLGAREAAELASWIDRECTAPVVLWGWSLGAGIALEAAGLLAGSRADSQTVSRAGSGPVAGVIAESGAVSVATPARATLRAIGLPSATVLGPALGLVSLRSGAVGRLAVTPPPPGSRPTLVLHGTADRICPPAEADAIADRTGGELVMLEGAGHHDLWSDAYRDAAANAVRGFLERFRRGPDQAPASTPATGDVSS